MAQPPPPNPINDAYQSFLRNTPLTTRLVLTWTSTTYIISYFFDPTILLVNTPSLSILNFQFYRLILSPFVCDQIFSLIFAFMSFLDSGKRIEYASGSTNFAALILTLSGIANLLHVVICFAIYAQTQNAMILESPSVGIWNLIMAVIAMECAMADPNSKRRIFVVEVPTKYYPLALLGFFALLSGGSFQMSYFIFVGIGYLAGYGKLDKIIKLKAERRKRWEGNNGVLRKFTEKEGFVPGPSGNTWNEIAAAPTRGQSNADSNTGGGAGANGAASSSSSQGWTPTIFKRPAGHSDTASSATTTEEQTIPSFEGSTGHRLGSASRSRSNASANGSNSTVSSSKVDRSAMLAAAERRVVKKGPVNDEEMGRK